MTVLCSVLAAPRTGLAHASIDFKLSQLLSVEMTLGRGNLHRMLLTYILEDT